MSEELENEEVVTEENEVVEMSDDEKVARASGWRPKEEFEGDPSKWVDAGEFNRRGEFYEAIRTANARAKAAEERLTALEQHHQKVAQIEYDKALKTLREERRQAARENDLERVIAADEKMDELEKEAAKNIPATSASNPVLDRFASDNKWYGTNADMTAFANGYGAMLERDNPNMPVEEILKKVKERTEQFFPDNSTRQTTTPAVVSPRTSIRSGSPAVKKRITYRDLPDEAKHVYNKLVKTPKNPRGIMEPEQYLKEYAAISGLPYEE